MPLHSPTLRRRVLVATAALLGLAAAAGCGGGASPFAGTVIDPPFTLPAGSFTDTASQPYDLAQQARGHVTVVYFGYTHCPDVCPTTMADLGDALRSLPAATAADIQVVFVTSDPRRDTPAVIGSWLDHFDSGLAHPFVGLRTTQDAVDAYARKVGVGLSPPTVATDGSEEVEHGAQTLVFSADAASHLIWTPGLTSQQYAADLAKVAAGRSA